MSKKYSVFITVLFCLFIFGFGIALVLSPSRDFSDQENRFLAQFKAPTLDTLRSGKFMEDFEDYVTDQFPLRDQWIRLKARSERLLGKQENNGVYFGSDGQTLFAQFTAPTDEELSQRLGFVNSLGDNLEVPVYFSLVPDKSVAYIDLRGDLTSAGDFYRTDHHWTTQGAQRAWWKLMAGMGRVQPKEDMDGVSYQGLSYTEVSNSFYGTTYSSSGAAWVRPDTIHTVIPEGGTKGHVTVTGYPEGLPIESSLYHPEKLEVKDKYAYFLGGNQPLCVIQNPDAPDGKLLVIRDSYSDSLAPFLAEQFQEVHLFDLRYNNMSVQQYVADNGIDQVLVLYSVANFSTDMNLFKLAH